MTLDKKVHPPGRQQFTDLYVYAVANILDFLRDNAVIAQELN